MGGATGPGKQCYGSLTYRNLWHPHFIGIVADKIFVAMENKVKAFNRKGKLFLSFDMNLTESIKSMWENSRIFESILFKLIECFRYVTGNELIICGNHVYNHFRDCKDVGSYLCGDTIVDVVALCPNNVKKARMWNKNVRKFKRNLTDKSHNNCTGMLWSSPPDSWALSCSSNYSIG